MSLRWHIRSQLSKFAIRLLRWTGWYDGYWNFWRGELFEYAQRRNLHILPTHYYSPIPDTSKLNEQIWADCSECPGVTLNIEQAAQWLPELTAPFRDEFDKFPDLRQESSPQSFFLANDAYSYGDAEILHSMVRHFRPRKIIEVGSGYSTLVIANAVRQSSADRPGAQCAFVAIEPYPPDYLRPLPLGLSQLMGTDLQTVPLDIFASLTAGDILFIDSSHVARTGGDVNRLYLDILPRLAPGVVIHIHDVFIPYEYPSDWIKEARFFWNEQYLLHAFLLFNTVFEVILPTHALFRQHHSQFARCIPSCGRVTTARPSSLWMRRKSEPPPV
jgi:hypothetical protein